MTFHDSPYLVSLALTRSVWLWLQALKADPEELPWLCGPVFRVVSGTQYLFGMYKGVNFEVNLYFKIALNDKWNGFSSLHTDSCSLLVMSICLTAFWRRHLNDTWPSNSCCWEPSSPFYPAPRLLVCPLTPGVSGRTSQSPKPSTPTSVFRASVSCYCPLPQPSACPYGFHVAIRGSFWKHSFDHTALKNI